MSEVQWHSVAPAPVVLVTGREQLFAQRVVQRLKDLSRAAHDNLEIHDLAAQETSKYDLAQVSAPSLFGEPRLVLIDDVAKGGDPLIEALIAYVASPEPDVSLVLLHRGDARGKKLIDTVKKSSYPWVSAAPLKKSKDIATFAMSEFSRAGRRINSDAVTSLVEAFGSDLMELAATCQQLMADTAPEDDSSAGPITLAHVHALTAGRADTTGFAVADATLAGRERDALALLRQAELAGIAPAALVGTFASKMRQLARVSIPGATASSLGMPEWMFRNQSREARHFTDRALAASLEAVARADAGVKGQERDPQWVLQRLIVEIVRARRAR
ncbi:MAG: DNA polymerase III subunit delta [Dermabacter sp.]|nr:DNA polymerase III subunit delta [Dermabacter sp.]